MNLRLDETGFGSLKIFQNPEEFCYGVDAVCWQALRLKQQLKSGANAKSWIWGLVQGLYL